MKLKYIVYTLLIFLSIFGIFFLSLLFEEIYHTQTMKGATEICFPTNLKINDSVQNGYLLAYTNFNMSEYKNIEEYNSIRENSEKQVFILKYIFLIILSGIVGYLMGKGYN